ncbi:dehydratase [Pseudomonas putida]|jgi:acyl dehydratase|uniref:Dehydratase n=1 Tax=Pseudomonas putida TaxID=303 RepID=A0A0P7CKK1_PSEPU|nr:MULTISPECIES: MaoC family dehydratase [Pseudomonas]KPM68663.1 dehydratase [Pseudomonas putida]MCS7747797.1 MaoC family dehydratase [Pseudomonas aeruginosa]MCS8000852.1 MaoC family dehydratase [Pseudomonas aeruginosa]MCS9648530.1 MaoC family dehydratase [Pseudomonas aeruginosa]RNF90108.1 MaoC family dehydratase [Pseudomonas putida]
METASGSKPLYLDDLAVGDVFVSDTHPLDTEQIVRFASQFDPQPFHLDAEAAEDTFFQGLAASGWHTTALTMRLIVQSLPLAKGVIGAGAEVSWPQPTRPGDVLQVTSRILEIIPSRSKPDRGIIAIECITSNQDGQVLQRMVTKVLCFRKAG